MRDVRSAVSAVWKQESGRIVAGLTRMVRDVGLAEELAQDALVAALEQWPASGVPDNPGAWLTAIAKRRAIDHIRRARRQENRDEQLARDQRTDEPEQDDVLRLMFLSCHPVLPTDARAALTLRLLGGLTTAEIARAFLATEPRIAHRIAEAKRTLADSGAPFELPSGPEAAQRLSSVLEVVYLIFNEGYSATSGDDLIRPGLCQEALRLGRLLAELVPREAEVHGLVALMEIQASRSAARTGPSGEPVQLHEQDRAKWDQQLIRRGFASMLRAREAGGPPGPYLLQAAIAACHAQAHTADETDWAQIAALYAALSRLVPTPVVHLNRAVAVGRAEGPAAGLALVDALVADPLLRDYHLLPGVRGDLLLRLGRDHEARLEFERAAALARNDAERAFLLRRADAIIPGDQAVRTLGAAARDFLSRDDLDEATLRSYGQTLRRLRRSLGEGLPMASLTPDRIAEAFTAAWGGAAAKTWNRHRSTVRSFGAWAGMDDLAASLVRRAETGSPAPAIDPALVRALCDREDLSLRERTLWLLLHESAAPVSAVLALDVEHLDLANRRARVGRTWVRWRSRTAAALPRLVAGRSRGPVFLSDRRPGPARTPAEADLCPETGRRRLSYERAEYLFKQATGFTLRRLRPSGQSMGWRGPSTAGVE
ncbi:sigma-70 family RNA polymerase sigma factor [Allokutzneria albata]|uniref:RNA polymerase sigma factor n=1 Tax=Allokutzneria albata TaxID=211114 RepID=A0A1H0A5J2_ALLAB|nr:sigma-70 family RNA polymerase sigma factor [Allokutzneria albata]SDN28006.1 RNA polymerase sigma factor, sigma-70 family [Allokutzneria albata]